MTMFPTIIYDLGDLKPKLPSLQRPLIDRAMAELMRMHRECAMLESALRRERQPVRVSILEDSL